MCQGVHRKVFPYRWRGDLCAPAEGEGDGGETYSQVPGRVLGPEGGEGGEGLMGVWPRPGWGSEGRRQH